MTEHPADTKPTVAWGLLRGYLAVLEGRGLLASVRELVSDGTRDIMDHPPLPITYVETQVMEELMDVTGRLYGREMVKDVALETARTKAGPLVIPFMRTLLTLWGATPESIFRHLHRLIGVVSRGLDVSYAPETPCSGTVQLSYSHPISDHVWASWEGVLPLAYDVCKVKGTIGRAEVSDGGRRGRIKVRWEPARVVAVTAGR